MYTTVATAAGWSVHDCRDGGRVEYSAATAGLGLGRGRRVRGVETRPLTGWTVQYPVLEEAASSRRARAPAAAYAGPAAATEPA